MYYKNDPIKSSINYVTKKKILRIYNTYNTALTPDTYSCCRIVKKKDMNRVEMWLTWGLQRWLHKIWVFLALYSKNGKGITLQQKSLTSFLCCRGGRDWVRDSITKHNFKILCLFHWKVEVSCRLFYNLTTTWTYFRVSILEFLRGTTNIGNFHFFKWCVFGQELPGFKDRESNGLAYV